MTNIKEVIHLYLGCEVLCNYNGKGFKAKGILSGKTISEQWEVIHEKLTFIYKYNLKNIKPILRRLDSLTWSDCPEWMPNGFDILISREAKYYYIEIDSKANDGFRLTIHSDGSMSCECKDNGEQYGYKGGELFAHLLKQGFDLFGLIDSGQAIDKNLKP